jgi:uncharacterized membrane protein YeaQ/YmgE (transglycosylase-associated protein family)
MSIACSPLLYTPNERSLLSFFRPWRRDGAVVASVHGQPRRSGIEGSLGMNGWLWFLIVGGIAGFLAGKIMSGHGFGVLGDIVVGIFGAVVGGFLFGLLGIAAGGLLGSIVVATVGAIACLAIVRVLRSA